jgi:hypothetical protein
MSTGKASAHALEDIQPVHLGQTQVQDQQVELVGSQGGIGLGTAGHLVHGIAGCTQRAQQAVGQHLVILGDQNPHHCLLSGPVGFCWPPRRSSCQQCSLPCRF